VLLAFALLFFARLLSALPRRKLIAPLAVLLLALGVYDQTPSPRVDPNSPHHQSVAVREQIAAADQRLVEKVEARLAPGALVYEFPAQDYPEAGWTARMSDYDPMRPYLWSKTLRFSYGNMKGRPEAAWQRQVAQMNDADRLTELQNKGFSAIYVLREGFEDSGQVDALLQALKERGHTEVIESDFGDSFFVVLRPVFP
jgi:phosphoglycerol transferase